MSSKDSLSATTRTAAISGTVAELHREAREIFHASLQESSIPAAFDRHLRLDDGGILRLSPGQPGSRSLPLNRYSKIYVVALGKAALPMLEALLEKLDRLPAKLPVRGVCSAPSSPEKPRLGIDYYAGGHPSPNRDSLRAARAALDLLRTADRHTLAVFLVSGGGSSLFEAPLREESPTPEISLDETIAFYRALVGCGATIAEINTVRKHFSAVKGGRLAAAAGEAFRLSLFISDVPDGHLDALASGPTLPDGSTVEECREIVERHCLLERFPPRVRAFFSRADLPETPRHLPGGSHAVVLLSNRDLLEAARSQAESRGWKTEIDNRCDDWDYREAARYLLERFHRLRREHPRLCLLSGGEITVRLEGTPGAGGRNQQFALACAVELASHPELARDWQDASAPGRRSGGSIAILSAGSDGVDGASPAAGAIVDPTTVTRAQALGFDAGIALRGFNAYPLFSALGDAVLSGPTGNNLRDLRILLSWEEKTPASGL